MACKSDYIIKVTGCAERGEYEGGKTLKEAHERAQSFLGFTKGRINIVRFAFGLGCAQDGTMEIEERVQS